MVANARRLGTASKLLFPVPDRGLSQRLYRISAPTEVLWGRSDRLIPPAYGDAFANALPGATLTLVDAAGHMLPYEQTEVVIDRLKQLASSTDG